MWSGSRLTNPAPASPARPNRLVDRRDGLLGDGAVSPPRPPRLPPEPARVRSERRVARGETARRRKSATGATAASPVANRVTFPHAGWPVRPAITRVGYAPALARRRTSRPSSTAATAARRRTTPCQKPIWKATTMAANVSTPRRIVFALRDIAERSTSNSRISSAAQRAKKGIGMRGLSPHLPDVPDSRSSDIPHAGPHQTAAARAPSRWRHALADLVRLSTRALDTEAAQRTFDFGDTRSYPLEILTRE